MKDLVIAPLPLNCGPSVSSLPSLGSTDKWAAPYTRSGLPFGFAELVLAAAL